VAIAFGTKCGPDGKIASVTVVEIWGHAGRRHRNSIEMKREHLSILVRIVGREVVENLADEAPDRTAARPYEDPDLPETWGDVDTRYLGSR
jgi:hypothetical protein